MAIKQEVIQLRITADAAEARKALTGIRGELEDINAGFEGLAPGSKEYTAQLNKLVDKTREFTDTASLKDLQKEYNKLRREVAQLAPGTEEFVRKSEQFKVVGQRYREMRGELYGVNKAQQQQGRLIGELAERYPALGILVQRYNLALDGSTSSLAKARAAAVALRGVLNTLGFVALVAGIAAGVTQLLRFQGQLDKTRETVYQFTGATGDELDQVTAKTQALADTFDEDFKQVLQGANALSREFGETLTDSLGNIKTGFVAGANANGEFLDKLKEYSAQASEAGLNQQQLIALINTEVREGIYSDKGIDAIKEAKLRIREMTPATQEAIDSIGLSSSELEAGLRSGSISYFEAIQMVSGQLQKLPPQSKEVGTAIADIFGGPGEDAGLRYLKLLADVDLELDAVNESADGFTRTRLKEVEASERLNLIWNQLLGTQNNLLRSMKANVRLFIADFLEKGISGTVDLINYFIDLYNNSVLFRGVIQSVRVAWMNVWDSFRAGAAALRNTFSGIGQIIEAAFTGKFRKIPGIVKDLGRDQRDTFQQAGQDIADNFMDGFLATTQQKAKVARVSLFSASDTEGKTAAEDAGQRDGEAYLAGVAGALTRDRNQVVNIQKAGVGFNGILGELKQSLKDAASVIDKELAGEEYNLALDIFNLSEDYDSGLYSYEEYLQKLSDLEEDYSEGRLERQLDLLEALTAAEGEHSEEVQELREAIAEQREEEARRRDELAKLQAATEADAERKLQDFRLGTAKQTLSFLKQFAGERMGILAGIFLAEQAAAAAEVIISLQREIAAINAAYNGIPVVGPPAAAALTAAAKVRAGISVGLIAAQTIGGLAGGNFEQGGVASFGMRKEGGVAAGSRHNEGGVKMVDGKTGQILGEMEQGEPYLILSRSTYRNNREVIDKLLKSSLYRNGAPIYQNGGVFTSAASAPAFIPSVNTGTDVTDELRGVLDQLNETLAGGVLARFGIDALDDIQRESAALERIRKGA